MVKAEIQTDVLVLGEHPATYLAAALLRTKSKLRVLHATIPEQSEPDRHVILNPAFFSLNPMLEGLKRKLDLTPVYGLEFVSDDPAVRSVHRSKTVLAYVAGSKDVREAMINVAAGQDVEMATPKRLEIHRVDEKGLEVTVGKTRLRPTVLVLGGKLPDEQSKRLGLPDSWERDLVHRYTFLKLPGSKWADLGSRPTMPMSLNLREILCWAWLMPGPKGVQLAVEQPLDTVSTVAPRQLLAHWADVLRRGGI